MGKRVGRGVGRKVERRVGRRVGRCRWREDWLWMAWGLVGDKTCIPLSPTSINPPT